MRLFLRIFLAALLLACACAGFLWYEAREFLETAPEAQGSEKLFDVPSGAHLERIARDLQGAGLVTDARKFVWLARYRNLAGRLQAGRFALNTGWKPDQVLDALVNGSPVLYRVTVPEGLTWWQTAQLLQDAGLARAADFDAVIHDPGFLRHYGIPFASAEGFLMPDTYLLKKPANPWPERADTPEDQALDEEWRAQARAVAGRMVDNFWRRSAAVWPRNGAGPDAPPIARRPPAEDLKKFVTLASIVEKETGFDDERARVAGVYQNRLDRGMRLQADPTVIYGLGPSFRGKLRRVQLDDASNAYNTYQTAGLPPGPIASFGLAALGAAIRPEKHDFIYFVAKTDGGRHNFSRTLDEHNNYVRQYLRQKK